MKFAFKFRVALPIPSQMTRILRKEGRTFRSQIRMNETERQWGESMGSVKVTVMTQSNQEGCLDTLF